MIIIKYSFLDNYDQDQFTFKYFLPVVISGWYMYFIYPFTLYLTDKYIVSYYIFISLIFNTIFALVFGIIIVIKLIRQKKNGKSR